MCFAEKKNRQNCNLHPISNPPNYPFIPCSVWFRVLQWRHSSDLIYVHTSLFVTCLSPSDRKITILVVADWFSKLDQCLWTNGQTDLSFAFGCQTLPVPEGDRNYQFSRFCLLIHDLIDNFAASRIYRALHYVSLMAQLLTQFNRDAPPEKNNSISQTAKSTTCYVHMTKSFWSQHQVIIVLTTTTEVMSLNEVLTSLMFKMFFFFFFVPQPNEKTDFVVICDGFGRQRRWM